MNSGNACMWGQVEKQETNGNGNERGNERGNESRHRQTLTWGGGRECFTTYLRHIGCR